MKRIKLVSCIPYILFIGILTGCSQVTEDLPELLEPVGVKFDTATASYSEIYKMNVYDGEVVPYVEELQFEVDGRLLECLVTEGETVEEGQLLAKLNDESLVKKLETLEEKIEDTIILGDFNERSIAADVEIARERISLLKEKGGKEETLKIREIEFEIQSTLLRQEKELRELKLGQLYRQVDEMKQQIADTELRAPFSGRVVYISQTKEGASIKGYTTVICIADDNKKLINSQYIPTTDIYSAQKISARILNDEYDITYLPYDDEEYISMVLTGVALNTRFAMNDQTAEDSIQCGQYALIEIMDTYKEKVLTIPVNALYRDEKGHYVYKVIDNERIRCNVTVGMTTDIEVEITEGLQEGDVVYVKE